MNDYKQLYIKAIKKLGELSDEELEKFLKSDFSAPTKEDKKDYKILQMVSFATAQPHDITEKCIKGTCKIYKVKRLSDNTEWYVGQKTKQGIITVLTRSLDKEDLLVHTDRGMGLLRTIELPEKEITIEEKREVTFLKFTKEQNEVIENVYVQFNDGEYTIKITLKK